MQKRYLLGLVPAFLVGCTTNEVSQEVVKEELDVLLTSDNPVQYIEQQRLLPNNQGSFLIRSISYNTPDKVCADFRAVSLKASGRLWYFENDYCVSVLKDSAAPKPSGQG